MELVINIVNIFYCFSCFSEFHQILTSNKIGNLTLRIIEQELNRFEVLRDDSKQLSDSTKSNQHINEQPKFLRMIQNQEILLIGTKQS